MKITNIQAQVKTKGRYSVFVDEKFAFGISELGLIESGIRIGRELSAVELVELKKDAQTDKLYNMTLNLIMRRPRSEWEINDYLRRKETESHVAEEICNRLRDKDLINDYDFAQRWVENRRLLKPTSKRKLQAELRQKRVADSVIQQVLQEDETEDFETLLAEIEKKRRQTRYQDETKLMQYLARQGYGYDDIKRALARNAG